LVRLGHEVRVVTAGDQPLQASLPVEIPAEAVFRSGWINPARGAEAVLGGREKVAARGFAGPATGLLGRLLLHLRYALKSVLVPDEQIGWYPYALAAAARAIAGWRPDVVYASAMPITSLLVARRVA